ncbi:MAG: alkaline phosphatase family protein [Planctomycetaceae bacterium]|nr:alkaline phosphatase family protein [Planctomycetaceae bacterium]
MRQPLLVINIAGLGHSAIGPNTPRVAELADRGGGAIALQPPVPALTSTSQATILTGTLPTAHGIVANGWYFRELAQVLNWQRSARLVNGEPIWETAKAADPSIECANLFWRYATHATCDVNVIERPTYWADGRKSEDIYTEPGSLRDELVERLGAFPLFRFWGPVANITSTRWIVDATLHLMEQQRFGLLLTYLPHLDYDHQRYGPQSPQGEAALRDMDAEAGRLIDRATENGMHIAVVSDYAFEPVSRPAFLNRVLREAGFIEVQKAENGELLEPSASTAFAICDQQIAHVYVNDASAVPKVKALLSNADGVEQIFDRDAMKNLGIDHPRSGELLVVAEPDCWFAYPYWLDNSQAPDFASCVAIHAKPGWDPAELFLAPGLRGKLHLAKRLLQKQLGLRAPFDVISTDASMVRGSHGRIPTGNENRPVLITSWQIDVADLLPMQDVKSLLLA